MVRCYLLKLAYGLPFLMLLCSCTSFASEYDFEVVPLIGFAVGGSFEDVHTGESIDVDEGFAYGLALNYDFNRRSQLQLLWTRQETELSEISRDESNIDLTIDYFHFGGTYSWYNTEKSSAYVITSVGATYLSPDKSRYDNEIYFSMGLGLGFKHHLTEHVGFVVEGRGLGTFTGGNTKIFCSSAGACYIRTDQDLFIQFLAYSGIVFSF